MKNNFTNAHHICGLLYEHKLELRESGKNSKHPGTPYISGTISIATDDAVTNIVTVRYGYTAVTYPGGKNEGKANPNFAILNNILNGTLKTYMEDKAKAAKLRIDSVLSLNEFPNRTNPDELVVARVNDGGFIHLVDVLEAPSQRNEFKCDMVITGTVRKEADPEKNLPEKVIVKGAIFNYKKELLPMEFVALSQGAMDYFEGLEASSKNPVFTTVWGTEVSTTVVKRITQESAFGDASVREVPSSRREFVITGAAPELPEQDDASTITWAELAKCIADREVHLATVKKDAADRRAAAAPSAFAAKPAATDMNFQF